jgi:hypothetical protein
MEISHGNPLYSYLKQTKMSFIFTKTDNRRVKQVLLRGLVPVGEGRMWGKSI